VAFAAALAVTLAASELLARGLTRLGTKVGFSDGLLGLLAALAADSPELSSAVIAILAGAGSVGVGVVVGSNLFNLAALLGLPALVAHGIRIRRGPLLLDAAVGLYGTLAAVLMVAGLVPPAAAALFVAPVGVAYVVVLAVPRTALRRVSRLMGGVPGNVSEVAYEVTHDRPAAGHGSWGPVYLLPVALVSVVGGSFVMVHEALDAQAWLHLSAAVLGTIVLASLTSLPNLWVALHFARTDRGTALFSSAMNSNSINIIGGLIVPALFVGIGQAVGSRADFIWLILVTMLAVIVPLHGGRLTRAHGVAIIAIYIAFVALRVAGV
jgi:cation:H+ antiporter